MLYSEFVHSAKQFLEISDKINDGWMLKNYKENVYLVKYVTQSLGVDTEEDEGSNESCVDLEFDEQAVNEPSRNFRKWEYHILHSLSYQVPVIYFNVWNSSGQLLSLNELFEAIHPNFKESVYKNKWFSLSQQEHPFLFKPFFYFHPCHTEEFLNCFSENRCNMLITWLSSIGQVIWLDLNTAYGENLCLK